VLLNWNQPVSLAMARKRAVARGLSRGTFQRLRRSAAISPGGGGIGRTSSTSGPVFLREDEIENEARLGEAIEMLAEAGELGPGSGVDANSESNESRERESGQVESTS